MNLNKLVSVTFVLCFFLMGMAFIGGCGDSNGNGNSGNSNGSSIKPVSEYSPIDPNGNIRHKVLDQLRAKRLPDPIGAVATLQPIEKVAERAKVSSDDFYRVLKGDLSQEGSEVTLWFYTKPDYEEYLGCRTFDAKKFISQQASEMLEARSYWIYATTYSPTSGYCYSTQLFITLLPGNNKVQLDFHPSGSFKVPCYILNPPGVYSSDWSAELENSGSISLWDNPTYNAESNELKFDLFYSDQYGNPGNFYDKKVELRIKGKDGLHILEFTFNPLDIISHQRPLELIAREIPAGTADFDGKFGFEDQEITINLDPNQIVNFPLTVTGTARGIKKVIVELHNENRGCYDEVVDVDPNGNYSSAMPLPAAPGDRLCISVWDWSRISDPEIAREVDGVTVNVTVGDIFILEKDNSIPDGTIEKPSGYAGQIGSPAGTFVAGLRAELQDAKISCYTADYPLGKIAHSLTLWQNGVQIGATISPLSSEWEAKVYTFEVGGLSVQKGDTFQVKVEPNDSLAAPVFFQMEIMVEGSTPDGTHIKTPYAKGQEIWIVPPVMITRDSSFSDASADFPTPSDKNGLINLGSYIATVYGRDFTALDFMASTKSPLLLGKYVETLMLVRRDMEAQVGNTIMYPPDNGVTPVVHSFHDESLLIPKEYKFQLYAIKHAGIDIPVEFQFQFSISGTTGEYLFHTPYVLGQKIYIAPSPPIIISPKEGAVITTSTFQLEGTASQGLLNIEVWQNGSMIWDAPKLVTSDMTFSIPIPLDYVALGPFTVKIREGGPGGDVRTEGKFILSGNEGNEVE